MRPLYVIPIRPDSKAPLEREWQFNAVPWEEAQARWPSVSRWGAPAGPLNGFWIYDEDVKNGGPNSTRALEAEFGPLPKTRTYGTPSGGRHLRYLWRDDRPVRNQQGLRDGIDIRGVGGQSLIPPTEGYSVLDAREPVEAPDWLYEVMGVGAPVAREAVQSERPPGLLVDRPGALADCRRWPPAVQGQDGSGTLFRLALRVVRGRGVPLDEAADLIEREYNPACIPPWTEEEIRHKVEDAATKGQVPWGFAFYYGTLPDVMLRALRRFGPDGHLDACVPYLVAPDGSMVEQMGESSLANAVIRVTAEIGLRTDDGKTLAGKDIRAICSWWRINARPEDLFPKALALGDEPGPSLVRLQIAEGPTPAWDQFLVRLSCPETFLAWVWMLTLPTTTRQILWITGGGQDGKTVVSNALSAMFGRAATACPDDYLDNSGRWLGSQVYGKRLVIVDDTKMRQVLRRGTVHRLTGGTTIKMEAKGADAFDFVPRCAVLCTSNFTPLIGRGRADRTRLLPLTVDGAERVSDSAWGVRLQAELPNLLGRARGAYGRLSAAGEEPQLRRTPPVEEALRAASGYDDRVYEERLERAGLVLDPAKSITGGELLNRLGVATHGNDWMDFYEWMVEQGVERVRRRTTTWTGVGVARD